MNRRDLFIALSAMPFFGWLKPKENKHIPKHHNQIGWMFWEEIEGFKRRTYEFVPLGTRGFLSDVSSFYPLDKDKCIYGIHWLEAKKEQSYNIGNYGRKTLNCGYFPIYDVIIGGDID